VGQLCSFGLLKNAFSSFTSVGKNKLQESHRLNVTVAISDGPYGVSYFKLDVDISTAALHQYILFTPTRLS
jgi:hypothetical protein